MPGSNHRRQYPQDRGRRTHRRRGAAAVAAAAVASLVAASPADAAPTSTHYTDQAFPSSLSSPTADKPQSKVWHTRWGWWALMARPAGGISVHRLTAGHTWKDTGIVVDTRSDSTADVLIAGQFMYVVSRTASGDVLYSSWRLSPVNNEPMPMDPPGRLLAGGVESASIASDAQGYLWVTFTKNKTVMYTRTARSRLDGFDPVEGLVWTRPAALPVPDATVSADDISAVVAFGDRLGILWSDQQSDAVRFAHRRAGLSGGWTVETVLSGADVADDHLSVKSLPFDGRVFAAVKTSYDDAGATTDSPLIYVLRRNADGTWSKKASHTIADKATRAQIALDPTGGRLFVLTTGPTSGGRIYWKSSPLSSLSFGTGRGTVLMESTGATLNDVSVPKEPVRADGGGLVAIASDTTGKRYHHAELSLG